VPFGGAIGWFLVVLRQAYLRAKRGSDHEVMFRGYRATGTSAKQVPFRGRPGEPVALQDATDMPLYQHIAARIAQLRELGLDTTVNRSETESGLPDGSKSTRVVR